VINLTPEFFAAARHRRCSALRRQLPVWVHAVNLKNRLRDIETDRANLAHAACFVDLIEPRLAERRRVAGRGHARRPWRPQ
jgi:hypothetical protein